MEQAVPIDLNPPFGGKLRAFGVAWFRREDYQRIREISHDQMIPTFDEWEAKMVKFLANQQAAGVILEKVIVGPDDLVAFAKRFHGGKIDTKVRGAFAAFVVMEKYGTNH
jgi:hypothetical protein